MILSDVPLKIKMNEELGKTTNKEKAIRIKNNVMMLQAANWMISYPLKA